MRVRHTSYDSRETLIFIVWNQFDFIANNKRHKGVWHDFLRAIRVGLWDCQNIKHDDLGFKRKSKIFKYQN